MKRFSISLNPDGETSRGFNVHGGEIDRWGISNSEEIDHVVMLRVFYLLWSTNNSPYLYLRFHNPQYHHEHSERIDTCDVPTCKLIIQSI